MQSGMRPECAEEHMPKKTGASRHRRFLERFSSAVTRWTGRHVGLPAGSRGIVLVWAADRPLFGFSDTWQLVINTGTTIVTFLMVFLIQRSQNKDSLAIQFKLNELVAALKGASNRLIDVEELSEEELQVLHRHYARSYDGEEGSRSARSRIRLKRRKRGTR